MGSRRAAPVVGVGRIRGRRPLRAERGRAGRSRLPQHSQPHPLHALQPRRSRRRRRRPAREDATASTGLRARSPIAFVARRKGIRTTVFEIHDAYLRIVEFESAISSLYFDALKDPLYSRARNDPRRRSAQSALLYALERILTARSLRFSRSPPRKPGKRFRQPLRRGTRERLRHVVLKPRRRLARARRSRRFVERPSRSARHASPRAASPRDFEAQSRRLLHRRDLYGRLHALGDNLREALVVSQLAAREDRRRRDASSAVIAPAAGRKMRTLLEISRPRNRSAASGRFAPTARQSSTI